MEPENTDLRAERVHSLLKLTMHNLRMHHQIVEKRFEGVGIHHSQHRLLMCLSKLGQTASQKDLARALDVSPACVARSLKALVQDGLAERAEARDDSRCNHVNITGQGKALIQDSCRVFGEIDREMFEGFTQEELGQMISFMQRMNDNLSAMQRSGDPDK